MERAHRNFTWDNQDGGPGSGTEKPATLVFSYVFLHCKDTARQPGMHLCPEEYDSFVFVCMADLSQRESFALVVVHG